MVFYYLHLKFAICTVLFSCSFLFAFSDLVFSLEISFTEWLYLGLLFSIYSLYIIYGFMSLAYLAISSCALFPIIVHVFKTMYVCFLPVAPYNKWNTHQFNYGDSFSEIIYSSWSLPHFYCYSFSSPQLVISMNNLINKPSY